MVLPVSELSVSILHACSPTLVAHSEVYEVYGAHEEHADTVQHGAYACIRCFVRGVHS